MLGKDNKLTVLWLWNGIQYNSVGYNVIDVHENDYWGGQDLEKHKFAQNSPFGGATVVQKEKENASD